MGIVGRLLIDYNISVLLITDLQGDKIIFINSVTTFSSCIVTFNTFVTNKAMVRFVHSFIHLHSVRGHWMSGGNTLRTVSILFKSVSRSHMEVLKS